MAHLPSCERSRPITLDRESLEHAPPNIASTLSNLIGDLVRQLNRNLHVYSPNLFSAGLFEYGKWLKYASAKELLVYATRATLASRRRRLREERNRAVPAPVGKPPGTDPRLRTAAIVRHSGALGACETPEQRPSRAREWRSLGNLARPAAAMPTCNGRSVRLTSGAVHESDLFPIGSPHRVKLAEGHTSVPERLSPHLRRHRIAIASVES